ncbi:hypothetical protein NS220_13240 [Microbacterium testaceum]|uniref:Uncharacterized protein n=1 Tax=Microbacterium testaceum TaxID=2033 RepID=A0A147EVJ9_MICTE|nr:hypothetical protein [Microbacterium testaceum]KTR93222.1 hypothetical protein NS220_13240 [Microbacterium testaceum]
MSHGLIDPSKLPGHNLDLAGVSQAAADISSRGGSIQQAGTDVASSWSALPASYESTGAESVYVAMNPVRDASDRVGGDLASVASALTDWVTTVQPILTRVADLRTDAEAFVVEANNFASRVTWTNNLAVTFLPVPVDNWWEDPDMVQRNADLVDQGYLLGEQLRVANEDLANAIRRSAGLSTNAVPPAATNAPDNLQTDWGSASPREESCAEKTIGFPMHLTGGVLNGAWDMVGGLGMLLGGYDFKSWPPPAWGMVGDMLSGDFQGAADRGGDWLSGWGQSWMGLGHLVTGVSMGFMAPVMSEVVAPGQISDLKAKGADTGFLEWQQQWMRDSYRSYIDLFGSFVGYHAPEEWWKATPDQWGEGWSDWGKDPGGTAGTSLFNIATLVLPTKGGGALLDGLKGGRGAEGLGDDVGRGGAVERPSGSTPESNGLHLRSDGLVDDGARFGGARDDLANTLERSSLDDGGTLLDDIRGGDHLVRPDADLPRVHAGDPDVQQFHIGDPDAPTVHHGGGEGHGAPDHGGPGIDGPGSPASPGRPPVGGTVENIGGHDIWLPDGFKHEGGDIVRYENGVPGSRIPADDYVGLRERSVHNGGSDTLMLGRFLKDDPASYIDVAKREGATYFDMGPEWGQAEAKYGLSPRDDMFDFFNRPVLDEAIRSGKTIRFSHDPFAKVSEGKFLEMEARYLEAHGFTIMEDANGWIAVG